MHFLKPRFHWHIGCPTSIFDRTIYNYLDFNKIDNKITAWTSFFIFEITRSRGILSLLFKKFDLNEVNYFENNLLSTVMNKGTPFSFAKLTLHLNLPSFPFSSLENESLVPFSRILQFSASPSSSRPPVSDIQII